MDALIHYFNVVSCSQAKWNVWKQSFLLLNNLVFWDKPSPKSATNIPNKAVQNSDITWQAVQQILKDDIQYLHWHLFQHCALVHFENHRSSHSRLTPVAMIRRKWQLQTLKPTYLIKLNYKGLQTKSIFHGRNMTNTRHLGDDHIAYNSSSVHSLPVPVFLWVPNRMFFLHQKKQGNFSTRNAHSVTWPYMHIHVIKDHFAWLRVISGAGYQNLHSEV